MSNLHGQRDATQRAAHRTNPIHNDDVAIRPAIGDEIQAALRLILSNGTRRAGDAELVDFLSFAVHRHIDLNGLWIAARNGRIAFAALPVPSPGRTMLLLSPPTVPDNELDTSAAALIAEVTTHYANRGVQLAQSLVDPAHRSSIRLFEHCGFDLLAELIYLFRGLRAGGGASWPQLPPAFRWETYSDATHARFAQTISASYEGSLDCPALNGVRHVDDVIEGHKAAGEFDPGLWFHLVEGPGSSTSAAAIARGVLLLSRSSRGDALELIYLGLTPAARGRGLGDVMMRQALAAAAATGSGGLSLAVDARNAPALKLYYRHGMQRVASRIAFMRDLRELRNIRAASNDTRSISAANTGR